MTQRDTFSFLGRSVFCFLGRLGKRKKFSPASDPRTPSGAETHFVTEALAFLSSDEDADGQLVVQHPIAPLKPASTLLLIPSGGFLYGRSAVPALSPRKDE